MTQGMIRGEVPLTTDGGQRWRLALGLLIGAWLVLGGLFHETLGAMARTWTVSASYNHGFLVLPISLWLAWRGRERLQALVPAAAPVAMLPLAAAALIWLGGSLVDVLVVQQLGVVAMLVAAAWALLGTPVARALAFPLGFLFLAVPMGKGLEPPMMAFTADWTVKLVRASGVPVYQEGLFFYLPTGSWSVVEACSGVRYLIASVTLGLLYAWLTYRSTWRRSLFVLAAVIVPIIANVLRAYGIVMLGHLSNMELATGVDHLIYGWIFFGVVMLLLFWIGSFWQENPAVAAASNGSAGAGVQPGGGSPAALVITAVLAVGIAWGTHALGDRLRVSAVVATAELQAPAALGGWRRLAQPFTAWRPAEQAADRQFVASYAADAPVTLFVRQVFAQAQGQKELVPYDDEWGGEGGAWRVVGQQVLGAGLPGGGPVEERLLRTTAGGERLLAWAWYEVDGEPAVSPYRVKWLEMRQQLLGGSRAGARLVLVTPMTEGEPAPARARLEGFLRVHRSVLDAALAAGLGSAPAGL